MLRTIASMCMALLAISAWAADESQAINLSGQWVGYYTYHNEVEAQKQGYQPSVTCMIISQDGSRFIARHFEPNTWGEPGSPSIEANLRGLVIEADGVWGVIALKDYDGSAGQTHRLEYRLNYDPTAQTLNGTWTIDAEWTGEVRFRRVNIVDEQAINP